MKNNNLMLFLFLALIFLPSIALAEVHSTQSLSGVYYHVSGDTSRSFYPANQADYLYEGKFDFSKIPVKEWEAFGNFEYRFTDDRLIDRQNASIERMYMGLKAPGKEILVGDFYQNFSEYTLGNALKGLRFSLGDEKSSRLIVVGGLDISSWEDLWETRQDDSSSRRYVWGARLENDLLSDKLSLNFNYGGARDDPAYMTTSVNPIMVNVFSVDGRYKINQHLDAYSEIAQSFTDPNINDGAEHTQADNAYKLGLDLNLKDYSLTSLYSWVGNNFNTTGGFAAQDLEELNFDGLWFLPLKTKFTHYLHMNRDNLSKSKSTTTKQINPGGKLAFTLPLELNWDLGFDMRKRVSEDRTVNQNTYTYSTNLSRDFRMLFASLGYTKGIIIDHVNADQERNTDTYTFALDGGFNIKQARLSWNVSENVVHDEYKSVQKADFLTYTVAGAKLVFPSTLTFEGKVSFGDNDYYINASDGNVTDYYFAISRDLIKDLAFIVSY
ncbi:MAG: hypothetical protein WC543_04325 [Candidatus Omnitrophota bacterium]